MVKTRRVPAGSPKKRQQKQQEQKLKEKMRGHGHGEPSSYHYAKKQTKQEIPGGKEE